MNPKLLRILNALTLVATIAVNGVGGARGFDGRNVGQISDMNPTLVTPAGYAFSIWSIIYLLLIGFVIYQWSAKAPSQHTQHIGPWFIISNLANSLWIVAFLTLHYWLSVGVMLVLLFALVQLVLRLRIATYDGGLRTMLFIWWPMAIYLGWIVAATVVNVSAALVAAGWAGGFLSPDQWGVVMVSIATAVYLFLIVTHNLRESALVGIWALWAIAVARGQAHPAVVNTAWVAMAILAVAIIIHGIRGWATSPLMKLKQGDWS